MDLGMSEEALGRLVAGVPSPWQRCACSRFASPPPERGEGTRNALPLHLGRWVEAAHRTPGWRGRRQALTLAALRLLSLRDSPSRAGEGTRNALPLHLGR
jgi:hypothetical protein